QMVKCNAAKILNQAVESMQALADQAQIKLIAQPLNIEMWADPDRLLQTFTNLLSNAIKFSESGSNVWINTELKKSEKFPSDLILFTVKDQGRGIPADKLHLIFERFQQVDASDSRKKGGTGLGLAICRHIVEQHEGKIWAESILGKGSTFHILLPCRKVPNSVEISK
ncbi:MAG: ATP-binding protein, partial [Phormidium sp.]